MALMAMSDTFDLPSRNEKREGKSKVSDIAIRAISSKLEMPALDEGFDALYYVSIVDGEFVVSDWRNEEKCGEMRRNEIRRSG
jgi:hypothetical protein